jgi:2-polyprenyl-3-methyl-5-hydroxy-6-metoxy-1,4-benzoquinol methylase
MDILSTVIRKALKGKLYCAPMSLEYAKVLDVGTGTGIWSIHVGDEISTCRVYGLDRTPIQPRMVPPNVESQVSDVEAEDDWSWAEPFNFIFCRQLNGSIKDWRRLIRQCHK